jgi:hypothetical protein
MSEKPTMNREALLKIVSLIKPAIATQTFIPAYNHIAFDGDFALTHNDIAAISVRCGFPEPCCVPGELLIKALGSFSAEQVMFQRVGEEKTLLVTSGRSKLKVPTMPLKSFPFELPVPGASAEEIQITPEMIDAIKQCLVSAGSNPNHPSAMGVTLDSDEEGFAVLFATDNFTISRHSTKEKLRLPGDAPVILPTPFCEQLIALTRAFPDLETSLFLLPGALLAEFGREGSEASLFTKTVADVEPLDFAKIIKKHIDVGRLDKTLAKIPKEFDAAFSRQLLVLGAEQDKVTKVSYSPPPDGSKDDGVISLRSTSQVGESNETFSFDGPSNAFSFHVDPALVVRGSKLCDRMALGERVLVMAGDQDRFIHIIAHVSAPAQKG